jgi:hypothetical protein
LSDSAAHARVFQCKYAARDEKFFFSNFRQEVTMTPKSWTLAAAFVAAAFSTAALAQDKPATRATSPNANKQVQSPEKGAVQSQEPANENMDSNAQRQHSRSTPAAAPSAKARGNAPAYSPQGADVRDWKAIDSNHDNLISPDEMEAELGKSRGATKQ